MSSKEIYVNISSFSRNQDYAMFDKLQILHISDLHISLKNNFDRSLVLDPLLKRLATDRDNGLSPELVFVTGDIAYSGVREEYGEAKKFLADLLKTLKLSPERLFLIPGNHDVDRNKYLPSMVPSYKTMEALNLELENPIYRDMHFVGMTDYFAFVQTTYPHLASKHGNLIPFVTTHQTRCGKCIGLVGLNSAWMCRKSPDREEVAIGEYQLKNAMRELKEQGTHDLVLVLFHHPLAWLWPMDRDICKSGWFNNMILLTGHLHDSDGEYGMGLYGAFHQFQAGGAYIGSESEWPSRYHYLTIDWAANRVRLDFRKFSNDKRWVLDGDKGEDGKTIFPLTQNKPDDETLQPKSQDSWPQRKLFSKYINAALVEHRHLPMQGFATTIRMPIELEHVYVNIRARISADDVIGRQGLVDPATQDMEMEREISSLDIKAALGAADRHHIKDLVILGRPGSGKTTLLKYILVVALLGNAPEMLGLSDKLIPILAPLRKLRDPRKEDFLDFLLRAGGLEECGVTTETLLEMFNNGCGLVLLDGLDEVADENLRRETCAWIDRARKRLLPETRFIVTSRYAGYFGESRLHGNNLELRVQNFNHDEVRNFLTRWFEVVETALHPGDEETLWSKRGRENGEKLATTIEGSEHLAKLAVNPLLLQIIALVHHDRRHIPERRVDLYEECTNVLLEKWDMAKGLDVLFSAKEARMVLQPLALWLHAVDERRSASLAEISELMKTPLEKLRKTEIDTEALLKNIRDRTGIFMGHNESEYGFVHLSFQEYLAAEEIRNTNKIELLIEKYGNRWWREVILLCLALNNPSPIDTFMERIIHTEKFRQEIDIVLDAINDSITKPDEPFIAALQAKDSPDWLREHCVRVLKEIGGEKVERILRQETTGNDVNILVGTAKMMATGLKFQAKVFPGTITIDKDGSEMVFIPAGSFLYGSREDDENAQSKEKPQRSIDLPAYYMDKYPVTNDQFCLFLNNVNHGKNKLEEWIYLAGELVSEKCRIIHKGKQFIVETGYENHPVIYVTWYGAEAYAKWAGKKLPSQDEWEKAARGTEGGIWPWGDEFDRNFCNVKESGIGHTTPVDRFRQGVSPYGCWDMSGNVWEWTNSDDEVLKGAKVQRGGSWYFNRDYSRCAARSRSLPNYWGGNRGFRCSMAAV